MFVDAVVVGGDGAGPHVDVLPQLGVADVAEVVHLAAGADAGLLDLHEVAHPAVRRQLGAGAQLGVGADGAVGRHHRLTHHRIQHLHPFADAGVVDQAAGADAAAVADHRLAAEVALGLHHHIPAEAGAVAEGAAGRIHEGDPLRHPVAPQPLLDHRLALGQLQPVVDAVDLIGVGHLQVHGRAEHRHRVGEVQLPLVVVGAQLRQHLRQFPPVEAVDAGVDQGVGPLGLAAVAVLHDRRHGPRGIGEHAAVAGGVRQAGGEQGHGRPTAAVPLQQLGDGLLPQQRHIAVEHQHLPLKPRQRLQQLLHRVARAVLGLLQHKLQRAASACPRQRLLHPLRLVAHDQQLAVRLEPFAAGQHPLHQGGARQGLQHLGQRTLHAGALPGGQHGNGEHRRRRATGPESTGGARRRP